MTHDDLTGQTIKGYELKERLGAGGFGAVYRAFQATVHRDVVVKVILPQYANNLEFIRRFEAEAQIVARLEHPYIVPLYDYWRDPTGAYLVMRWLQSSLRNTLHGKPLPLNLTVRLVDQIASALAVAHRRGIIHRDLKPDNILLDGDQNAYLADFGIAKDLTFAADQTEAGQIVGTLTVISPEQLRAEPVTARSDLYSLGLVLFEILIGHQAFSATSPSEWVMKHLHEPVPFVRVWRPELPEAVDRVIQKATAKNPDDRYPDALSMAVAFREALGSGQSSVIAHPLHDSPVVTPNISFEYTPLVTPASAREMHLPTEFGAMGSTLDDITVTPAMAENLLTDKNLTAPLILTPISPANTGVLPPMVENPYKGLRAFQEGDAVDFFGRDRLIRRLLDRLNVDDDRNTPRFLAVVGPSGSGKSSVVRAGLIPALRRGALPGSAQWFGTVITPGSYPLEELEAALLRIAINPPNSLLTQIQEDERGLLRAIKRVMPAGESNRFVLVIDQFEEMFTLVDDEATRAHLLKSLVAAVREPNSPLVLIVTLRADYYDRPLQYAAFGDLLQQHTEIVLPLNPDELEQVISSPAKRVGLALEPGLTDAIRNDLVDQPGVLPLLEYALTELYDRQEGATLTLAAYRASGGALGAVTRRADILYNLLDLAGQAAVRQLFLRLVTFGEGRDVMRRRVPQPELLSLSADPAPMEMAIARYGQHYLLTFDRDPITRTPTVEVAHEALIRSWPRLQEWLDANRDDLQVQHRLSAATIEWQTAIRDMSFLASGARLEQFKTLLDKGAVSLSRDEREYVTVSLDTEEKRRTEAIRQAEHETSLQRTAANRLRALAGSLAIFLMVAVGLSAVAFSSRADALNNAATATVSQGQALNNAATAQWNYTQSESLRLASEADSVLQNPTGNAELAALLSVRALQIAYSPQADSASVQAAARLYTLTRLSGHSRGVVSVAYASNGQFVVTGSGDNTARLWSPATGQTLRTLSGHRDTVTSVAISSDSKLILTSSADKTARVWDAATGDLLQTFKSPAVVVTSAAFSPDGQTIVLGYADMNTRVWAIADASLLQTFSGHTGAITRVAFAPDGKAIATGSIDKTARLWDAQTGKLLQTFSGHSDVVTSVAFAPNGKTLVTGSVDKTARLWDVSSGALLRQFVGHADGVWSVAISADGQTLLTGSHDKTARLWDLHSGALQRVFSGHENWVTSAAFSPDARTIITGSEDMTARLWTTGSPAAVRQLTGHSGPVRSAAVSPDGTIIVTGSEDTTARVWDAHTLALRFTLSGHTDTVTSVAVSPDSRHILTGSYDKTARWWDAQTGKLLQTFSGHSNPISTVAISPDGRYVLTGSWDKTARLWDVQTGELVRSFDGHTDRVTSAAFSPNSKLIVTGSADNTAQVWDALTGKSLHTLIGHSAAVSSVAFSSDNATIATGSADKTVRLWDAATGQFVRQLTGFTAAAVSSIAFSPDGKLFAMGNADKTAQIWDTQTWQPIRQLPGHTDLVASVGFFADSQYVISGSYDGTARIWDSRPSAWRSVVCAHLFRDLSALDRSHYNIDNAAPICP